MPIAGALRDAGAGAIVIVAAVGAAGAVVHLLSLRSLFPAVWSDLLSLVRRLLPSRGPRRRPALSSSAG